MNESSAFDRVLAAYTQRSVEEDALASSLPMAELNGRRNEFLLAVGPEVAALLQDLVTGLRAKTIVDLGTSYGYSTLFLAAAAKQVGGKEFTYEIAPAKQMKWQ